jgi:hypothetical protein
MRVRWPGLSPVVGILIPQSPSRRIFFEWINPAFLKLAKENQELSHAFLYCVVCRQHSRNLCGCQRLTILAQTYESGSDEKDGTHFRLAILIMKGRRV